VEKESKSVLITPYLHLQDRFSLVTCVIARAPV